MKPRRRIGLVLSGGGARGAYEVGVLAHLFEHVLPKLPPDFEFDVVSGTSVGAIHASYVAATSHWDGAARARQLEDTWKDMEVGQVVRLGVGDLFGVPLRALGFSQLRRRAGGKAKAPEVIGGLLDVSPLERIVADRVPWSSLRENLQKPRPRALCVLCTEVGAGRLAVFMDGPLADPSPWATDPNTIAISTTISVGPRACVGGDPVPLPGRADRRPLLRRRRAAHEHAALSCAATRLRTVARGCVEAQPACAAEGACVRGRRDHAAGVPDRQSARCTAARSAPGRDPSTARGQCAARQGVAIYGDGVHRERERGRAREARRRVPDRRHRGGAPERGHRPHRRRLLSQAWQGCARRVAVAADASRRCAACPTTKRTCSRISSSIAASPAELVALGREDARRQEDEILALLAE